MVLRFLFACDDRLEVSPYFPVVPMLMIRNNYANDYYSVIPMTISLSPKLMEDNIFIKIADKDIEKVKNFVITNHNLLMKHWNQKINTDSLIKKIKKYS